ncbi:MAG: nickel pincer cofactor biosynthesis protein LarC [Solobacterium sp.]|nr:nickel pincer cofactor biosynthesis protein LarC [Solobacterium sp.]
MKTLYLECRMGAAGDMLTAALSELVNKEEFLRIMNSCGLEGVQFEAETVRNSGITGTHMHVVINGEEEMTEDVHEHMHAHGEEHEHHHHDHEHEHHHHDHDHEHEHGHHHHHAHMHDIEAVIRGLNVSESVKEHAVAVYQLIAEAESHAHGQPVEEIHFHEVGTKDAIADVTAVCVLMEMIGADRVLASPVATGSGYVRCAHGVLPVPAPATAYILQGIPSYSGMESGELLTPTGAALLKHFVQSFETMPVMTVEKIGYGFGRKEFKTLNAVRAFLADMEDDGEVCELVCNLDDMTPEEIGFAQEEIMAAGALDVYTVPAYMKKNRPGLLFQVMCRTDDREKMIALMFKHTTTLGIRETVSRRHALKRSFSEQETDSGTVRIKSSEGYGTLRTKAEYEDLARIARAEGISLFEARKKLK